MPETGRDSSCPQPLQHRGRDAAPCRHEALKFDRASDGSLVSRKTVQAERSTRPAEPAAPADLVLVVAAAVLVAAVVVLETTTPWELVTVVVVEPSALVTTVVVSAALDAVLPAVPPLPVPRLEILPLIAATPKLPITHPRYATLGVDVIDNRLGNKNV